MKAKNEMKWVGIGVRGLILMALLCTAPLASGERGEKKKPAVNPVEFSEFMGNIALGVEDLAEGAEIQREFFNTITPPGVELFQPMFPSAIPFEDRDFTDDFLAGLLGWDRNSVTVYPIQLLLDPETRQTLIYNLKGELIASSPNLWGPRMDLGGSERISLLVDLVPSEDVQPYLYTESRIFQSLMEIVSQSKSSGGMAKMSSGGTNHLEAIEIGKSNGSMAVTFAWPTSFTNRIDIYSYDGGSYKGEGFGLWTPADSGLITLGTNQLLWIDTGQLGRSANPERMRFFAAGNADLDQDGDGYSSGYEQLVLNTDPTLGDTDGDGVSDGPFDPDGTNSVTSGPDAFPLDDSESMDTDGDGIGDNADTDDDGDGLLDGVDPEPLIPGIVAPFKVVSVISTNPPGSDSSNEVFDVSSAGRMLPYASGSDAKNGYGRLFGGIYFNHDGTNLYIGVAGYSQTELAEGENALLLVLDTKSGGVTGLNAITSGPKGLSVSDNLRFQSGTFEPDVGILAGNRNEDGRNNSTAQMGGKEYGQGVYALSGSSATHLTPAFTASGPSPISQWGDTPYSTNLANAGIEIAIPLSNILDSAWSSTSTTIIQVAAIVMGGDNGTQRWLSSEAYGHSVTGSFSTNTTTLLGENVYLSPNPAPEPKTTPMFTDSEVMIQGFGWNVPRVPEQYFNTMTLAGSFTAWDPTLNNMTSVGDNTWEYIYDFTTAVNSIEFKFVANGDTTEWTNQWSEVNSTSFALPVTNEHAEFQQNNNIVVTGAISGPIRFRFNNGSQFYSVEAVSNTNKTFLPGYSDIPWYERLKQQVESNDFAKFDRVWMNPPQKGKSGKYSVGYDPFDYFDLGTYDQKDTVATRYGTEAQLKACVQAFEAKGIDCLADMVLNHMNNSDATYRYDYEYSDHQTFEKRNASGGDTNGYFNANYTNYPFQFDNGWGLPAGTNAWDPYPGAHSADVNERHPYMRNGIKNNGTWLQAKVGYRGCRFDYTQGMEPWFFAEYMNYGLMKDRFAVGEYWADVKDASPREHQTWISLMDNRVSSFDFPLHEKLAKMCNDGGDFNMEELSHGALIHVDPERAVTFVESHDEVRPFGGDGDDKLGMEQNKEMAYAFILMSEGHPCIFGQDYFDAPYADTDEHGTGWTGDPLKPSLDPMIDARKDYAGGTTTYLSTAHKDDLFIAKRNGTDSKDGCIFVINDDMTQTLTNSVNTGWAQNTVLVDVLQTNHTVQVQAGGMAPLSASNRYYRVYVRQSAM